MQKLLLLVLAALTLSACNTVKGVGQDVSKGGQVIENAAKDVSNKM
ncbi:entericidin A/B family lipoprotein [Chromobacterium haemolyticum]|uniref:Entericidin A/B family lipoprotein n=1 Tax=Chromobacterium fluminis TaxID=3044269 RepID=A0ABX0L3N5_9NEIS|nr:entericidin A/B family lipoprotein [Chromobacterium haemolyticum]NHR06444.1 entericidin A/B family lipoprotein [Chromobacterium haemolyticum]